MVWNGECEFLIVKINPNDDNKCLSLLNMFSDFVFVGALFATIFTLESVCEVFSGALFNSIYAATVGSFKGLVFIVQAAILAFAAVFLL